MKRGLTIGRVRWGFFLGGMLGWIALTGCSAANSTQNASAAAEPITPPGHVSHVVLFSLIEGTDEGAFIDDCRDLLSPIPGVTALSCGRHLDTGRNDVQGDYDVGVSVGLASAAAYRDYLTHPKHLELLDRWGPAIDSYRIYDIQDTPAE